MSEIKRTRCQVCDNRTKCWKHYGLGLFLCPLCVSSWLAYGQNADLVRFLSWVIRRLKNRNRDVANANQAMADREALARLVKT